MTDNMAKKPTPNYGHSRILNMGYPSANQYPDPEDSQARSTPGLGLHRQAFNGRPFFTSSHTRPQLIDTPSSPSHYTLPAAGNYNPRLNLNCTSTSSRTSALVSNRYMYEYLSETNPQSEPPPAPPPSSYLTQFGGNTDWHQGYSSEMRLSQDSRTEFEAASALQRGRSRKGLGEKDFDWVQSDRDQYAETEIYGENVTEGGPSGDEESLEDDPEYSSFMTQVDKYKKNHVAEMRNNGCDYDTDDFEAIIRSGAFSGLPKAIQQQSEDTSPDGPKRRGGARHRGPRPAVEPTGDIKLRLGRANEAFQENKIDDARVLVDEIIRINAETYEAWTLLSSIFQERRQAKDALMALIVAAHLRPKHVEAWFNCGEYAMYSMGEQTERTLRDAQFCYASAVRHVPTNLEARRRKAHVLMLRENYNQAASEYRNILRANPHDLAVIRELAVVYIDLHKAANGIDLYKGIFEYFRTEKQEYEDQINWNDLDSYAVLYSFLNQDEAALKELKSLARWLLGRENEEFWDEVTENDCEWDEHDLRRSGVLGYTAGSFPASAYGDGLPIELRVNLGKFRLNLGHCDEALHHFNWLYATDGSRQNQVLSHPHLILEVADLLFKAEQYKNALVFYKALHQMPEQMTASAQVQMGKCFLHEELIAEAESCFHTACKLDEENIEGRVELARLFERMDEAEQAFIYVNQVLDLESIKRPKIYRRRNKHALKAPRQKPELLRHTGPKYRAGKEPLEDEVNDQQEEEVYLAGYLQDRYHILKKETDRMRSGDDRAMDVWMDSAQLLTEDFRSCRAFYPWDKKEFEGYSKEEQVQAQLSLKSNLAVLAQRHARNIGAEAPEATDIPSQYRGIPFKDWREIFSEYALCLARRGRNREAYDVCEAALHAIIFCFSREDMFVIYIAYCMCALISNDEETCVAIARWFMVQYQFVTDSYRMFAAVTRMCHSPVSWYNSGPTQKFILRQIKTMDYSLASKERREKFYREKAGYSNRNEKGEIVINDKLDIALLMTYGYILAAGSSFVFAMNYFYRAYALDPENPMINLSLGLAYIQHSVKRQAENRQHGILQGLTFMHKYYDSRKEDENLDERQEAHYNIGRTYHLIGLTHLAIPYYRKVLNGAMEKNGSSREDLVIDTAYNLQTIYVMAGNMELAGSVTKKWLVV